MLLHVLAAATTVRWESYMGGRQIAEDDLDLSREDTEGTHAGTGTAGGVPEAGEARYS